MIAPPLIRGWRAWLAGFVFWTVIGLLMFGYHYLDVVARAGSDSVRTVLIEEFSGSYVTGLLSIGLIRLGRVIQGNQLVWFRAVLIHSIVAPVYSAVHTSLLWGSRLAVFGILGLGTYDYGKMPVRYFMEGGRNLIDYFILASLIHLVLYYRSSRERAIRVAHLERELTNARLQALEGQLRPHFLFNALNTVSSVMYRDVDAADKVLSKIGELLRSSLESHDEHLVTVEKEIDTLTLYLDVMRARFGDRLSVEVDVDPAVHGAKIPHLLFQPIVENTFEHGNPDGDLPAKVIVRVRKTDGKVHCTIEDNGGGAGETVDFGVGLGNTAARLEHMFGANHRFVVGNNGRGFKVEVELPFET